MSSTADPIVRMETEEAGKAKGPARAQRVKDLYATMKKHQSQLEFMDITEEYLKDEMRNLKRELIRAKEEVKRIQSVPLVVRLEWASNERTSDIEEDGATNLTLCNHSCLRPRRNVHVYHQPTGWSI